MTRPSEGDFVVVLPTEHTSDLRVAGLYGVVERCDRSWAWVVIDGTRYRLFYDEFAKAAGT